MPKETRRNLLTDDQLRLIDERMEAKGMTDDADLVRALGVDASTVSKWRSRQSGISKGRIEQLAAVLDVSVAQLSDPKGFKIALGDNVAGIVTVDDPDEEDRDEFDRLDLYDGLAAAGRILDVENLPDPIGRVKAPAGFENDIVAPNFIGIIVRGESMKGWPARPILDGDIAWVNLQDERWQSGVVAAVVRQGEDEPKAIIKHYDGERLWSWRADGSKERVQDVEIVAMTKVFAVTTPTPTTKL